MRQRRALAGKNNKLITRSGAQCYPRLACPLYVSVFMQLHHISKGPPVLAGLDANDPQTIMQIHAYRSCIAVRGWFKRKIWIKFTKPLTTAARLNQIQNTFTQRYRAGNLKLEKI
ncbi:MAG: hypothetical protein E6750_20850, partial [Atlantibacter hermannii]|uniref:hypothetical protein n=1 Tax=Atlantibacter hermannii TaxID=565 RepID=UPI002903B0BD